MTRGNCIQHAGVKTKIELTQYLFYRRRLWYNGAHHLVSLLSAARKRGRGHSVEKASAIMKYRATGFLFEKVRGSLYY